MTTPNPNPSAAAPVSATRLSREMGVSTAAIVVVANMVGVGIFTTTGFMISYTGSPALVLLCWLLGGLIALAGALCYAELATMMPRAGAEYRYLREIYGPLPAFLTGWVSFFVGFSAPSASAAVGAAKYLAAAGVLEEGWVAEKTAAVLLVASLTAVHYCGVRFGSRVQAALTGLNLTVLGGLILAGLSAPNANWRFLDAPAPAGEGSLFGLGTALLLAMFAYSGWNAAAYLGEEVREPARTLPRSLLLGTLGVMALYLLLNLMYFVAAPAEKLAGQEAVAAVAIGSLFGERTAGWLGALVSISLASALSAYLLIGPRVYYAMANDGLFFRFAAQVHPRFRTPSLSIVAQGACAVLMAVSGTFEQLLTYIGFALGIFPWMAVLGLVLLRRRQPGRERPYRVWGYPVTPLFFLTAMALILTMALLNRPVPSLLALVTVAAGVPVYLLTVRRKS